MNKLRVARDHVCPLMLGLPLIGSSTLMSIKLCSKDDSESHCALTMLKNFKKNCLFDPICHLALLWSNGVQNPQLLTQGWPRSASFLLSACRLLNSPWTCP
ncbi:hypothetical protein FOMPIDRAFT_1024827 [Fomitopsis schrenkii]|uniref:Uncharacterized protein n=1 Tax=Fomitopsis schrenkii TaxID=2126942 RepID=S8DYA4_FOMSC|nr:hypothetical protein FOMPIDRAFT_1024827 [Fomitopsis schrenkii]